MNRFSRLWILGLVLTAGCDSSNQPSSQIIATVNGDEISVHQLNYNISQRGLFVQGDSDRKAITEGLIDRQLMVQEALTYKLDRQPEVMMQLEEARLQVLAAAYEKFITEKNTQPRDGGV